jgi:hypothetical protein
MPIKLNAWRNSPRRAIDALRTEAHQSSNRNEEFLSLVGRARLFAFKERE